jgi:DNA-binding response OmpR family regulator
MQGDKPVRILAVSGDAGSQHIDAALAAGFDAYLTKPIDARAMLAEADFALRSSSDSSQHSG